VCTVAPPPGSWCDKEGRTVVPITMASEVDLRNLVACRAYLIEKVGISITEDLVRKIVAHVIDRGNLRAILDAGNMFAKFGCFSSKSVSGFRSNDYKRIAGSKPDGFDYSDHVFLESPEVREDVNEMVSKAAEIHVERSQMFGGFLSKVPSETCVEVTAQDSREVESRVSEARSTFLDPGDDDKKVPVDVVISQTAEGCEVLGIVDGACAEDPGLAVVVDLKILHYKHYLDALLECLADRKEVHVKYVRVDFVGEKFSKDLFLEIVRGFRKCMSGDSPEFCVALRRLCELYIYWSRDDEDPDIRGKFGDPVACLLAATVVVVATCVFKVVGCEMRGLVFSSVT